MPLRAGGCRVVQGPGVAAHPEALCSGGVRAQHALLPRHLPLLLCHHGAHRLLGELPVRSHAPTLLQFRGLPPHPLLVQCPSSVPCPLPVPYPSPGAMSLSQRCVPAPVPDPSQRRAPSRCHIPALVPCPIPSVMSHSRCHVPAPVSCPLPVLCPSPAVQLTSGSFGSQHKKKGLLAAMDSPSLDTGEGLGARGGDVPGAGGSFSSFKPFLCQRAEAGMSGGLSSLLWG